MSRGGDFIRAHEELKMMTNAVFRQAGFATTVEPPNIFHGKIPPDCIEKYINLHQRRDAIIPDILVHNHPGDRNAVGACHIESIYDIKTLRVDKSQAFYSETRKRNFRRAVDTKVMRVRKEYMTRAEKLDIKCGANFNTHPFSEALKNNFNLGGFHPVVFRAFGETNLETERMIKKCAKYAASRSENSDVTPLCNTLRKGTTYQVMLSQFRRAIGVLFVRTAAEIKIRRTALIHRTRTEINAAAQLEQRRWYENSGNPFWYQNRDNEEHFHEFYAYHTQYNNFILTYEVYRGQTEESYDTYTIT